MSKQCTIAALAKALLHTRGTSRRWLAWERDYTNRAAFVKSTTRLIRLL